MIFKVHQTQTILWIYDDSQESNLLFFQLRKYKGLSEALNIKAVKEKVERKQRKVVDSAKFFFSCDFKLHCRKMLFKYIIICIPK